MLEKLARLKLARAATALNRSAKCKLPALVLMTDDERLPDPLAAARALPRGSMIVVRARQSSHRAKLARSLQAIARDRSPIGCKHVGFICQKRTPAARRSGARAGRNG
jgi:hypothetical protein